MTEPLTWDKYIVFICSDVKFFPLSLGHRVNDGLWHSVSLDTRSLQITLTVDNEPASTIEQWEQLEARGSIYFGGQWMLKVRLNWKDTLICLSCYIQYQKKLLNGFWYPPACQDKDLCTWCVISTQAVPQRSVRTWLWPSRAACASYPSTASQSTSITSSKDCLEFIMKFSLTPAT